MIRTSVFDQAPGLASGLDLVATATALRQCTAVPMVVPPTPRFSARQREIPDDALVLILTGFVLRRIGCVGECGLELLGPGDVVPVGEQRRSEHRVLTPTTIAVLDDSFLSSIAPWPRIGSNIATRVSERADRLVAGFALVHLKQLTQRLHAALWQLAERWGTATRSGIWLPFRLYQQEIADLTGARRPSVSAALRQLCDRGALTTGAMGHHIVSSPDSAAEGSGFGGI